jgi:hypothetical protein
MNWFQSTKAKAIETINSSIFDYLQIGFEPVPVYFYIELLSTQINKINNIRIVFFL